MTIENIDAYMCEMTTNPYEPDPCYNGITTLRFMLPCTADSPTMEQWCANPDADHSVIDGVDLCATVPQPAPALPTTGTSSGIAVGGGLTLAVGALLHLVGQRRPVHR